MKLNHALLISLLALQNLGAATFTVTSTADSGAGSLRAALAAAASGDTIDASGVSGTILLTSGELLVSSSVNIVGPGPASLAVDGNGTNRVFHIAPNLTVSISNLTIMNGNTGTYGEGGGVLNDRSTLAVNNCNLSSNQADADGGGISSSGNLQVYNSVLHGNKVGDGGYGGAAIANVTGTLSVSNCTISGNATYRGGGIYNYFGTVQIAASTLSSNTANIYGGGIYNNNGTLVVVRSKFSDNLGYYGGGGIFNIAGPLDISESTLSRNRVTIGNLGGAIFNNSGFGGTAPATIANCTLNSTTGSSGVFVTGTGASLAIGNTLMNLGSGDFNLLNDPGIFNVPGTVTSLGYNLSSDAGGGVLTNATDQINTDPKLGPLQDNGGPTFTHALLPGSPAIDQGKNFSGSTSDQRGAGFARTSDDPSIPNAAGGDGTDIGAFEVQSVPPPLPPVAVIHISPLFQILPADTHLYVLAPNNAQATVHLDGSDSSDPANRPLQFTWYADGQSSVLASGAVPAVQLPIGTHTVTLSVNDGLLSGTAQVQFEIITPGAAVDQLQALVEASTLDRQHKHKLLEILGDADRAFDRGHFHQGSEALESFEAQIRRHVAPTDAALASQLTAASQLILSTVGDTDHDRDGHNHHETGESHEDGKSGKGH